MAPSPTLFAHEERDLPGGLRVLLIHKPHLQRATISLYLRVGARHETRETSGLSHFLEHMLFRGTPSYPTCHAQALAFERLGGTLEALTSTDHGVLSVTLPTETLTAALNPLGEVVRSPLLSDIEIERGIVEEEIREDLDDHGRQINADILVRELLYPEHPLGFPVTGSLEQLHRYDVEALRNHHARHYTAANMVLAVAGNFPVDEAWNALTSAFTALPTGKRLDVTPAPPLPRSARFRYVASDSSQTDLRIAFRGPGEHHPDEPAIEMLLRILDDGMATRLYGRLCNDKGLCYDVSATVETYEDDGVFDLAAETQHERAPTVAREMLNLCRELAEHGPTQDELDIARARLAWSTRAMLDDPEQLASFYGLAALANVTLSPEVRCRELLAVTREQIRDAAAALFRPERLGVVAVGSLSRGLQRELEKLTRSFR
ncbi:MAG: pitrilysin family protein [Myxococcales bacterium]|nr:insulinase family protein [Polyangiaceae bacterium]MDW8247972.1 pitrilysin family protein [Myxococcales bacterium]